MTLNQLSIPSEGWPQPWPLLLEVADACTDGIWSVVGGTMVQIHAELAGIEPPRVTADVDLLLDLMSRGTSFGGIASQLERLGFGPDQPSHPGAPFHRFRRADDVIDLLVADHLPGHIHPRWLRQPVMSIDGGAQALQRLTHVDLIHHGTTTTVTVPDLLGALVLKAAAAIADSRDAARHEADAALLAALITDHDSELARMHGSDRRRIRALAARLESPRNPAWVQLPGELAIRGRETISIFTSSATYAQRDQAAHYPL